MEHPKLEALNKEITAYVSAAIAKFHGQNKGIRVTDCNILSEELNPPGVRYDIKIGLQVTFPNKTTPE